MDPREGDDYRTLFFAIDAGFCIVDVQFDDEDQAIDCRIAEANAAFRRLTGLAEPIGRSMRDLAPEHWQRWLDAYGFVARTGHPLRFEDQSERLDRCFDFYALPFGNLSKERRVALLFSDITYRKNSEDALFRRERTLAQAGKMAKLGAWDIEVRDDADLSAGALTWSDEVYRIFGYEPGSVSVTNELFFSHVHPDDVAKIGDAVRNSIESRQPYTIEHRIRRTDGEERIVLEHAERLDDPHGKLIRIIGAVQDVTESKRSEEALRESDRRKGEFIAMLSHELRNPLAPIRNGLRLLELAPPGSDRAWRALATIGRQVEHMTRLVEDLLDVTRISRGKIELHRDVLDLGTVVTRTIEDHRAAAEERGIEIRVATTGGIWVDGDATRLTQVIGNLLANAIKFSFSGGRITVEVSEEQETAVIRIADTGIGVAPDMLPHLFEPFAQADQSLDRSAGGLGLGLSLVKGLVELHGGEVRVASEGAGRGTTVTVRLPSVQAPPRHVPDAPRVHPRPQRILIIEDNIDAAETLKDLLEFYSHEVAVASNGTEGLAKAREFSPDVVLCDIGLPGMDGYEVARTVRADDSLRDITLIALTGYAGPDDRRKARAAGFDHHLAKPSDPRTLQRLLASDGAMQPAG